MIQTDRNFSCILDHKELLETFEIKQQMPEFQIHAGLYKDNGGFKQFGFMIVDRRFNEAKYYIEVLGANFCNKDSREWFAQVITRWMVDVVKQSHRNTMDEIHKAQGKLDKLLSM